MHSTCLWKNISSTPCSSKTRSNIPIYFCPYSCLRGNIRHCNRRRRGHQSLRMSASLGEPLPFSLFLSSDPAMVSAVWRFSQSVVCTWLCAMHVSLMWVDITGAEGVRGGAGCRDEQQWLELECCTPQNRRSTVQCSTTMWATSSKYQIHCFFNHPIKMTVHLHPRERGCCVHIHCKCWKDIYQCLCTSVFYDLTPGWMSAYLVFFNLWFFK